MSNTTIQKRAHEVEIYGKLHRVEVGTMIWPDGWAGPTKLQGSSWDAAEFYLPSYRYEGVVMAVNIRVTGRTLQRRSFSNRYLIRVQIEFLSDDGENTFSPGWMVTEGGR